MLCNLQSISPYRKSLAVDCVPAKLTILCNISLTAPTRCVLRTEYGSSLAALPQEQPPHTSARGIGSPGTATGRSWYRMIPHPALHAHTGPRTPQSSSIIKHFDPQRTRPQAVQGGYAMCGAERIKNALACAHRNKTSGRGYTAWRYCWPALAGAGRTSN